MRLIRESHSTGFSSASSARKANCTSGRRPVSYLQSCCFAAIKFLVIATSIASRTSSDDYSLTTESDMDEIGYQGDGPAVADSSREANSSAEFYDVIAGEHLRARQDYVPELVPDRAAAAVPLDGDNSGNRRSVDQNGGKFPTQATMKSLCSPSPATMTSLLPTKIIGSDTESPVSDTKVFVVPVDKIRSVRLWHGLEVSDSF